MESRACVMCREQLRFLGLIHRLFSRFKIAPTEDLSYHRRMKTNHIVSFDQIGAEQWDAFVQQQPESSLYHFSAWRDVFKKTYGLNAFYLACVDTQDQIQGVLPLLQQKSRLFGHHLISLPFFINYADVLAVNDEVAQQLYNGALELAKAQRADSMTLRSTHTKPLSWPCREDKICMHLSLPDDPDILSKALGAKRRSQIKRPEREGIEIIHGGLECVDDFYEVIAHNMRDLGSPVHARKLYQEICKAFPENTHIVVIKKDQRPVAAGFLIGYKGLLEIPWASSLREYNRIGVNMRLYWEVLKYAIEQGYHTFDFGRSSKDSGTYRFKKQWGAEPVQCYWYTWNKSGETETSLSNENPKFQLAIKIWQRLPVGIAKTIGPHLVKYLP